MTKKKRVTARIPRILAAVGILLIAAAGASTAQGFRGNGGGRSDGTGGVAVPTSGAMVVTVAKDSPAEKAGLARGDVIQSVDGKALDATNTLTTLIGAHKAGDTVKLSVWTARRGAAASTKDVAVVLAANPSKADAAYLGVEYRDIPAVTQAPGTQTPGDRTPAIPLPGMPRGVAGTVVTDVTADSPAAKAGVKTGDIITIFDGTRVSGSDEIVQAVAGHKPGDSVSLTVFRTAEGRTVDLTATLGASPSDAGKAWLGIAMGFGGGRMQTAPRTVPAPRAQQS